MNIIKPKAEILTPDISKSENIEAIYQKIELAGRTCYKSEDKIKKDSARKFVAALVKSGHEAMIEHAYMTVRFIVDRGVSHELVRHRIASFAQSSTRYCNYSQDKFGNEITVIKPLFLEEGTEGYKTWLQAMIATENTYFKMLDIGYTPQEARAVLPNSLMTEVVVTASMREWRHIFKLRAAGTTGKPHPQMVEVMLPLLLQCQKAMPELFGDIKVEFYD